MPRPRVFLSSTCYDLNDVRAALTKYLDGYGFEVFNSQLGTFGVTPKSHSHQACLDEVKNADYLILIIGGRRGGTFIGSERSITNEELLLAQKLSIPILAFVDWKVNEQRHTFRRNPRANFKHVVDDNRVFDFIDFVASGYEDNWLHPFHNVTEIIETLTHQFAHYLQLYSRSLRPSGQKDEKARPAIIPFPNNTDAIETDFPDRLEATQMRKDLRLVHEAIESILDSDVKTGAKLEQLKTLWVIGRHGDADERGVEMREDRFKASAWGTSRGRRVFGQMEGSRVTGDYDHRIDGDGIPYGTVRISFSECGDGDGPGHALKYWIDALKKRYGEQEAHELFMRGDMRLFGSGLASAASIDSQSSARPRQR